MLHLRAQAVGKWLAMNEQSHVCFALVYDATDEEPGPALCHFPAPLGRLTSSSHEGTAAGADGRVVQ